MTMIHCKNPQPDTVRARVAQLGFSAWDGQAGLIMFALAGGFYGVYQRCATDYHRYSIKQSRRARR